MVRQSLSEASNLVKAIIHQTTAILASLVTKSRLIRLSIFRKVFCEGWEGEGTKTFFTTEAQRTQSFEENESVANPLRFGGEMPHPVLDVLPLNSVPGDGTTVGSDLRADRQH